ncbi:bacteriocin biosynthesis cyclodehydratase domain-containing protein [Granulicella aggregans]|uniref:Bacteriocin biosynthesis cyclodehydratase domain-containing protein n=1 Tax=Granulicella aggregans TaxID=474949 RepID=A0A7W8E6V8_9BACT|nr:TOMM precursor leader peptide-binding protein [Granulicella aggregans]MBB5061067.1 bacteriocin biosynthesis cyclodehydratase domain-containing protein [Granulicella aggregans]
MKRILYQAPDSFGEDVYCYLAQLCPDVTFLRVAFASPFDGPMPSDFDAFLVVASAQAAELCTLFDDLAHRQAKPLLTLLIEENCLRLGPLVMPRSGPCWQCAYRRQQQHTQVASDRGLSNASASMAAAQPTALDMQEKIFQPILLLAAARIAHLLRTIDNGCAVAGSVWQMNLLTLQVQQSTVVGIHGCPKCGLQRSLNLLSTGELQQTIKNLWAPTAEAE